MRFELELQRRGDALVGQIDDADAGIELVGDPLGTVGPSKQSSVSPRRLRHPETRIAGRSTFSVAAGATCSKTLPERVNRAFDIPELLGKFGEVHRIH